MDKPTFENAPQRPSLTSLLAHKERLARAQKIAQGKDPDMTSEEATYSETDLKLMAEAKAMSLQEHLQELRKRIIISVIFIVIGASVAYYYSEDLLRILTAPAGKLYYMRPTEAFFTYMKVSIYAGILMASPVLIYEIWAFVMPALTKGEKKISNVLVPIAIFLFWAGVLFSYFFVLPAAIKFFIGFATDELQPLFSVGQYLDFLVAFIFPFGIVFELPLVIVILAHFDLISSAYLRKQQKYFILLAFIIGAVISPTPDIFSQSMIAMPMILLYEISYFVTRYVMKK